MTSPPHTLEPDAAVMDRHPEPAPAAGELYGVWSYRTALLLIILNMIRPQDWVSGFAGFNIIRPVILLWCLSFMTEGRHSPLHGFVRTPHDWVILIFYGYIWWNAPSGTGAGGGVFALIFFYFFTTQSLTSWEKLLGYLKAWNVLLLILATLGVLQTLGIDITHGKEITDYGRGRLALGTWTCNNPNALGHTIVAALPLSYILFFWRGTGFSRFVLFPLAVAVVVLCAFYTQSKGSFLVGAGLSVLVFVVGKPKWMQIIVLAAAITSGVGALSFLPRMSDMGNLRADEGVVGRLMAWEMALNSCRDNLTGVGWKQFEAWITVKEGNSFLVVHKATHSSYVQIGAELGIPGMFLWLLILWVSLRRVMAFRAQNDTEERCRRCIMLILCAYITSSWMINREYHIEYYLMVAAAAAMHRLAAARNLSLQQEGSADAAPEGTLDSLAAPEGTPDSLAAPAGPAASYGASAWTMLNRLDWKDYAVAAVATWGVLRLWEYILINL